MRDGSFTEVNGILIKHVSSALPQFSAQNLAPASRSRAQVHRSPHTCRKRTKACCITRYSFYTFLCLSISEWRAFQGESLNSDAAHFLVNHVRELGPTFKEVELLIQLQQLEGTAGAPALLFSEPVVNIPFVFGGTTHGSKLSHDPLVQRDTAEDC